MQLCSTLILVDETLEQISGTLVKSCERYRSALMPARSDLSQAVPISFGFKIARLLATFDRHKQRLDEVRSRLPVVEFGGAAGTLATLSPDDEHDAGFKY